MLHYQSNNRDTGVTAYELGENFIDVQFKDGRTYRYSYKKPGKAAVEEMKRLAELGKGLTTYINQHVRERYGRRLE